MFLIMCSHNIGARMRTYPNLWERLSMSQMYISPRILIECNCFFLKSSPWRYKMRLRKNIFGIQTEDEQIRLIAHEAATASAFFGGKYAGGEQCTRFLHFPPKKDIFCCRFIGENYPGSLLGKCRLDCSALEFYNRNRSRKLCGSSHILVKFAGWRDPNQFFFFAVAGSHALESSPQNAAVGEMQHRVQSV